MYLLKLSSLLVALAAALIAGAAHAITVTGAKIDKGAVQVKGKGATPNATISWEGQAVGQASRSGGFKFSTSILPSDCVGEVGDGASTAAAVVSACAPAARSLVLRDANGSIVGPVIETFPANTSHQQLPAVRVGHSIGQRALLLLLTRIGSFPSGRAYYESEDCSGPALIPSLPGASTFSIATTPWVGIGPTVYYSTSEPSSRLTKSYREMSGYEDVVGLCTMAVNQRELSESTTLTLAPPFHIEVQ